MSEAVLVRARELDVPTLAVIATDAAGSVIYWSSGARRLYGWDPADALGRNILDLTPSEATKEMAAEIMCRLRSGQSWSGEFTVRDRSGRSFVCDVTDVPVRGAEGELLGIIGLSQRIPTSRSRASLVTHAVSRRAHVRAGRIDAPPQATEPSAAS
jgi:PAS domain S-box-containing protein